MINFHVFLRKNLCNENQEGVNISIKKTTLLISVVLMFFILLGAVNAVELNNVTNTGASNLMIDDNGLSLANFEDNNENLILEKSLESDSYSSNDDIILKGNTSQTVTDNTTTKVGTKLQTYNAHYSKANTVFKISLKDTNGSKLENQSVTLKINGKTYKSTTNENGMAYFTTPSLKKGTYSVTAKYNGDSQYTKSSITNKVKVVSSISGADMAITYNDNKNYTAKFYRDNNNLNESTVKITLNGKTYKIKTDQAGVAQISLSNLSPGTYKIKLYNPYSKETVTKTITVNKAKTKITGTDEYILPKTKSSYSVVLKNNKNKPMKNVKIRFNYNNKQVTASTNANGEATISIPALSKGTYTITYKYNGNSKYKAASGSKKLYVKDSTTKLTAKDLKMQYNDGSSFIIKASTTSGKALSNKTIKITLNGTTTKVTTDSNGTAKLTIGNLKLGIYNIKCSYSTKGLKDYNTQKNKVTITKQTVNIIANDMVMKYNSGSNFQVTIKNQTGANINGVEVKFTLNGKTTKVNTDANGIAKLSVSENIGYYPIDIEIVSDLYTSSKVTKHILVNGTVFTANDITISPNTASTFQVKVVDGQNKPVKTTIKFTLNNKVQSVKTDDQGIAKLTISGLAKGIYSVTYTDGTTTGSSRITVVNKIALKDIITASQNVKKYIENNGELPNTVKIGTTDYSTANFVYLAAKAIINLKSNNKNDIDVISVSNPTKPQAAENLGDLYNYLAVAKSIVDTCNKTGVMPNSVSSERGNIGYNGLVYALARTVAFYGDYSIMPNYVTIKTYSTSTSSSSLNSKNTIKDLTAYLKATTNCQVGNKQIKTLVESLTAGLTTDIAKAKAIYNYVRDYISYSFYYDTRYGAVGTLNAKTGNCVDQAHLLIAMYRTAGLAARYAHGTCVFSSGSTYGHVWAQVLIGDTWVVSDPTSARNSFGNVVNWNNYNYSLKGYYASIAF